MIDTHLSVTRSLYSLDFPICRLLFSLVHGQDHLKRTPEFSIGESRRFIPSIDFGGPSDRQSGPLYEPDRGWLDLYVRFRVRVSTYSVVARVKLKLLARISPRASSNGFHEVLWEAVVV